jgi:hypothetical protein
LSTTATTSGQSTARQSLHDRIWAWRYEWAALAVVAAGFAYGADLALRFSPEGGWKIDALYAGILGWASIQAGALLAVYTFVAAGGNSFIRAISHTDAISRFHAYVLRTTYLSLAVAAAALILSVTNPVPQPDFASRALFALWYGACTYMTLRMFSIVRILHTIDRAGLRRQSINPL